MATTGKKFTTKTAASPAAKPRGKAATVDKTNSKKSKTLPKKPAAKAPAKTATRVGKAKPAAPLPVSPEHRYHMIATAAYYLPERRGFAGG